MELVTSPKTTFLLDAGLDVLHEQSTEWLNEIAFWRDETAFFYSLIVTKTFKSVPTNSKNDLEKIEKELISITGGELDKLENAVAEHEKFLSYLMECQDENQESYRDKHKELTHTFNQFEKRYKFLKKEIFSFVEKINK
jgi:hypothetical protein